MGESGHVTIRSLASSTELPHLVGRPLTAVDRIVLPISPKTIGVQLQFDGPSVVIVNWGDDLFATAALPTNLIEMGARVETS